LFPDSIPFPLKLSDKVREVVFRSVRWRGGAHYQNEFDGPSREFHRKVQAQAPVRPDFAFDFQDLHGTLPRHPARNPGPNPEWITRR